MSRARDSEDSSSSTHHGLLELGFSRASFKGVPGLLLWKLKTLLRCLKCCFPRRAPCDDRVWD